METASRRNSQTSWESLSRADVGVFCFTLEGNKQSTLYIPALKDQIPLEKSERQKKKNSVFFFLLASPPTLARVIFLYAKGRACFEAHNERGMFQKDGSGGLNVKPSSRLFVLLRMSCLSGQSRHETRKRDVASVRGQRGTESCWHNFQCEPMFSVVTFQAPAPGTFTPNTAGLWHFGWKLASPFLNRPNHLH